MNPLLKCRGGWDGAVGKLHAGGGSSCLSLSLSFFLSLSHSMRLSQTTFAIDRQIAEFVTGLTRAGQEHPAGRMWPAARTLPGSGIDRLLFSVIV